MAESGVYFVGESTMGAEPEVPRVLVIRSETLRDRVAAALEAAGVTADINLSPSYLSAMGWLTQQRAAVVVGPVSAMTGMVGSTARALRKLSPGMRLVALADDDERAEASAAASAGFDQCVYEPADAGVLVSAIGLESQKRDGASATMQGKPEEDARVSAADNAVKMESLQLESQSPGQDWLDKGFDEQGLANVSGTVGDVDLAEAVMRRDGSLLPLAMRLLRDQSGLADAAFAPLGQADGNARFAVDVSYEGTNFGALTSQDGDVQALGSWSAWLARWVALDRRQGELYEMAMHDKLTGIWNRRYFELFLERVLQHAAQGRQQVTLLVFDIDNFKQYNDSFGHPAGDEILKSTAVLIQSLVRDHDIVARIGGDEFAVIFWDKGEPRHLGSQHPNNVIGIAKRFQKAICEHKFPKLGEEAVGRLTVSGGLAGFPWDGRTTDELLARADAMAMRSKQQGKNAICFGPGAAPNGNGNH
ncbi:MAG: GGDEF domain-containing protein [Phycisphaeraceae bacterium]|nr:GGDEF domain-containing protein [Phycisphaeraceae bacterium]